MGILTVCDCRKLLELWSNEKLHHLTTPTKKYLYLSYLSVHKKQRVRFEIRPLRATFEMIPLKLTFEMWALFTDFTSHKSKEVTESYYLAERNVHRSMRTPQNCGVALLIRQSKTGFSEISEKH